MITEILLCLDSDKHIDGKVAATLYEVAKLITSNNNFQRYNDIAEAMLVHICLTCAGKGTVGVEKEHSVTCPVCSGSGWNCNLPRMK